MRAVQCVLRIESDQVEVRNQGRALAARFGLTMTDHAADTELTLALRDDGLELRDAETKPGRGLRVDFTRLARRSRESVNLSRRQPLARAIGRDTRRMIDATAGLGQDAALLAAMGFEVTAIERSGALAAMLDEAMRRAGDDPPTARLLGNRLQFQHGDARRPLADDGLEAIDCVYLDPMFPLKRKASALARKEIRLVRALVGEDEDAADLLSVARHAARRVVVKRPTYAPPLASDTATKIEGKLVRYDVYVRPAHRHD